MSDGSDLGDKDAFEALDRVLEELRREFRANPEFAHRVVKALGAEVFFGSDLAAKLINPIELVAKKSPEEASITLQNMSLSELKTIAKTSQLASPTDLAGKSKEEVAAMIELRARRRLEARSSSS